MSGLIVKERCLWYLPSLQQGIDVFAESVEVQQRHFHVVASELDVDKYQLFYVGGMCEFTDVVPLDNPQGLAIAHTMEAASRMFNDLIRFIQREYDTQQVSQVKPCIEHYQLV